MESVEDLQRLEERLLGNNATLPLAKRVIAVRLRKQQYSVMQISEIVGMSPSWVYKQLRRYRREGLDQLLRWRGQHWYDLLQQRAKSNEYWFPPWKSEHMVLW